MGSPDPRDGDVAGRQIAAFLHGDPIPVPAPAAPPSAQRDVEPPAPEVAAVIPLSREVLRSRRKRVVRAKTENMKRMPRFRLEILRARAEMDLEAAGDFFSPTTRGDCANVVRPCPHVSCKHHLYLDVSERTGAIKLNFPDLEPGDLPPDASCALDVAALGGETLERVAERLNLVRERVRQIEQKALRRIYATAPAALREHAGVAEGRASTHFSSMMNGGGPRGAPTPVPIDDGGDGGGPPVAESDELQAVRWGSICGHFMIVAGLPLRLAMDRTYEWLDEQPGELPEGCTLVLPEPNLRVAALVTPPERLLPVPVVPSPPREEGYVSLEQRIERGAYLELPSPDERDDEGQPHGNSARLRVRMSKPVEAICSKCTHPVAWHALRGDLTIPACSHCGCIDCKPLATKAEKAERREKRAAQDRRWDEMLAERAVKKAARATGRRRPDLVAAINSGAVACPLQTRATVSTRPAAPGPDDATNTTPATAPEKDRDRTMSFAEQVYAALEKAGETTAAAIGETLGADSVKVSNTLGSLLRQGRVDRSGGRHGAKWTLGTGKSTKGDAVATPRATAKLAKKAARKQAKRAKANGKSNGQANGHAAPPAPSTGSTMGDAVAMLKAALTEDFNRKLAALEVLAK